MQSLDTIHQCLALCGAPHKRRYVAMSVMLSCFMGTSFDRHLSVATAT